MVPCQNVEIMMHLVLGKGGEGLFDNELKDLYYYVNRVEIAYFGGIRSECDKGVFTLRSHLQTI